MTAKKEVSDGARSLKRFFDELAGYIVEFGARILAGDFNLALWQVVPELRARGVQANLAAWYPWKNHLENHTRMDSCAIIMIWKCEAIGKTHDTSALGFEMPELPYSWRNT